MDVRYLNFSAAREFELLEREDLKLEFGERALALYQDTSSSFRPNQTMTGRTLYLLGRLEEAEQLFADRVAARPTSRSAHAFLGIVQAAQGKTEEALARIDSLSGFERQYDLGYIPYRQARIYAKLGQLSSACEQLNRALTEGQRFIFTAFSNEPDFLGMKDERCFRPYLDPN